MFLVATPYSFNHFATCPPLFQSTLKLPLRMQNEEVQDPYFPPNPNPPLPTTPPSLLPLTLQPCSLQPTTPLQTKKRNVKSTLLSSETWTLNVDPRWLGAVWEACRRRQSSARSRCSRTGSRSVTPQSTLGPVCCACPSTPRPRHDAKAHNRSSTDQQAVSPSLNLHAFFFVCVCVYLSVWR